MKGASCGMRIAAVVAEDGNTIVGLTEGPTVLIYDTETKNTHEFPNPAMTDQSERRRRVVDLIARQGADLACAVPGSFCPHSQEAAIQHGIRFIVVDEGSRFSSVIAEPERYAAGAVSKLPPSLLFTHTSRHEHHH